MLQAGSTLSRFGVASPVGVELVLWMLVVVALLARVAWARPIVRHRHPRDGPRVARGIASVALIGAASTLSQITNATAQPDAG